MAGVEGSSRLGKKKLFWNIEGTYQARLIFPVSVQPPVFCIVSKGAQDVEELLKDGAALHHEAFCNSQQDIRKLIKAQWLQAIDRSESCIAVV